MIVGIFVLVQNRFDLFDVKILEKENIDTKYMEEIPADLENDDQYVEISIPNGIRVRVNVEVADNDSLRTLGLSGRKYLGDYDGMLFIFDQDVDHSFWMKDMEIPLDIIFLDSGGYIVDIKHDQPICSSNSCPKIISSEDYMFVLEVNSGFCKENGIEVGYSMIQYL